MIFHFTVLWNDTHQRNDFFLTQCFLTDSDNWLLRHKTNLFSVTNLS